MTPNGIAAAPSFVIIPGMIVCSERLDGPMALGWPASIRKALPRFWNRTPVRASAIAEPNFANSELMKLIALPSPSTTAR